MFQRILYGIPHGTGAIILRTGTRGDHTTGIIIMAIIHIIIITITGIIVIAIIIVTRIIMIIITMVTALIPTLFTSTGKAVCIKIPIPILKPGARDRLTLAKNILTGIVRLPDQV